MGRSEEVGHFVFVVGQSWRLIVFL